MVQSDKFFVIFRIADFNVSNSRTFFDHFPPCRNSLAGCSLAFRQDICLNGHRGLPRLKFLPMKFSILQKSWLNSPVLHDHCRIHFSVELVFVFFFSEDIETLFVLVKLMIADQLILWDLRLKVFRCVKISWHRWDTCFIFLPERAKVIFSVSIIKPGNSICFKGRRTDFLRLITKTQVL